MGLSLFHPPMGCVWKIIDPAQNIFIIQTHTETAGRAAAVHTGIRKRLITHVTFIIIMTRRA